MLPIRSKCKECSHCINKNVDAQETYKQREFRNSFQVNENCMTVILISKATVQSQSYLNERNVLSSQLCITVIISIIYQVLRVS